MLGGGVLGGGVLGGGFIYLYEPRCESGARRVGELERTHWIGRGHLAADDRVRLPRTRLPIRENRPVVPCAEGARRESDGSRGCVSNLCVELAEDLRMGQVPKKTGEVRHTEHMLRCLGGVGGGYGGGTGHTRKSRLCDRLADGVEDVLLRRFGCANVVEPEPRGWRALQIAVQYRTVLSQMKTR